MSRLTRITRRRLMIFSFIAEKKSGKGENKCGVSGIKQEHYEIYCLNYGDVSMVEIIQGRLGYNSENNRYGLLVLDLWEDTGFHCGECLDVLVDDSWLQTRMEFSWERREWYLVGTPYSGDLEYIRARIMA